MGDISRSARGGMQIEKLFGRQRIALDLAATDVKFDRFSELDYQGRNLDGSWMWSVGNRLAGKANVNYLRTLASFDTFHSLVRRIRTDRHGDFDIRWQLHPRWQIRGAIGHDDSVYSDAVQESGNRRENSGEAGFDYATPGGTTVGIFARRVEGIYPIPVDPAVVSTSNKFYQNELRGRFLWNVSGKTTVQFSGGRVARNHAAPFAKDFRGGNARATADWAVTRNTVVTAVFWRELGIVDDSFAAYSINVGASMGARWAMSEKLQADLHFRAESRDFRSSQLGVQSIQYGDLTRSVQSSLSYSPGRHWLIQPSIFHTAREGRGVLTSFNRNGVSITAQYKF